MTRRDFTDRVLLPLTKLTWEEREDIRRELEEHIEDRMEYYLEKGWDEAPAEARCLEAMGDPAEIGQEMARQYRRLDRGWLWLGRAAVLLTVVLCVQALLGLGMLGFVWDSFTVRFLQIPPVWEAEMDTIEANGPSELRIPVGNDIVRVAWVNVGERKGERQAEVLLYSYDRVPGGVVARSALRCLTLENQRGERGLHQGGYTGHYMVERSIRYVPVEPGDTYVTLSYDWLGESFRVQVPLPEREIKWNAGKIEWNAA